MFSNAVTDIIQDCDHENLQQQLRSICEVVYNKLNEHLTNPSLMGHLNKEQQEILMNNWNSVLQPLIVRMGTSAIDDNMLGAFVQIAVGSFHRAQRVTSGGIFVLQGLTSAVEHRIEPHISQFIDFLTCSLRMQESDEMSTRLSAGLISDISNSIGDGFVRYLP